VEEEPYSVNKNVHKSRRGSSVKTRYFWQKKNRAPNEVTRTPLHPISGYERRKNYLKNIKNYSWWPDIKLTIFVDMIARGNYIGRD
jgi:hypothetical protein